MLRFVQYSFLCLPVIHRLPFVFALYVLFSPPPCFWKKCHLL